jgi:hypothetical protein
MQALRLTPLATSCMKCLACPITRPVMKSSVASLCCSGLLARRGPLRLGLLLVALQREQKPRAVVRRDLHPDLLEAQPRAMRVLDRLALPLRHVDRIRLALGIELQGQVRAVAARRIVGAGTGGIAALRRATPGVKGWPRRSGGLL